MWMFTAIPGASAAERSAEPECVQGLRCYVSQPFVAAVAYDLQEADTRVLFETDLDSYAPKSLPDPDENALSHERNHVTSFFRW
jgi:hypothetical protein